MSTQPRPDSHSPPRLSKGLPGGTQHRGAVIRAPVVCAPTAAGALRAQRARLTIAAPIRRDESAARHSRREAAQASSMISWRRRPVTEMGRQVTLVLYVMAMVAVIVGVDFAFFRNRFWERLAVNIGIVLVFGAFYWSFLRRP